MSHAYSEDIMFVFQKAEDALKDGFVTLSTTWWMRCCDATVGRYERQDSLIGWVFDGYLMRRARSELACCHGRRKPFAMKVNFV